LLDLLFPGRLKWDGEFGFLEESKDQSSAYAANRKVDVKTVAKLVLLQSQSSPWSWYKMRQTWGDTDKVSRESSAKGPLTRNVA
jgi:hypothetical protein